MQPRESKIPLRKALAKTVTGFKTRQHSRRSATDLPGYAIFRRPPRFLGTGKREQGPNRQGEQNRQGPNK